MTALTHTSNSSWLQVCQRVNDFQAKIVPRIHQRLHYSHAQLSEATKQFHISEIWFMHASRVEYNVSLTMLYNNFESCRSKGLTDEALGGEVGFPFL